MCTMPGTYPAGCKFPYQVFQSFSERAFKIRTVIFLLTALFIAGCANTYRYEKKDLVAFGGIINGTGSPQYYLIRINVEDENNTPLPKFLVMLSSDAEPVLLSNLKPDYVSMHLPSFVPPKQWPKKLKDKALLYQSYEGNGFYISFREDRLSSFGACSNCGGMKHSPIIGKADGSVFHKLPLTYDQVLDVFGDPDRLYKVREVTY